MDYRSIGVSKGIDNLGRIAIPLGVRDFRREEVSITFYEDEEIVKLKVVNTSLQKFMQEIQYIHKVDSLNRFVLPSAIRTRMNIREGSQMDILIFNGEIAIGLRVLQLKCCLCGRNDTELHPVQNNKVCENCIDHIKENF